jgi:hypothetical protein
MFLKILTTFYEVAPSLNTLKTPIPPSCSLPDLFLKMLIVLVSGGEFRNLKAGDTFHKQDPQSVIPVTEVILARAPRALEGEVKGGSSLEGAGKGRLWRKGSYPFVR